MTQPSDLLLTSCNSSRRWTSCLWDYVSGNTIQTYKNGGIASQKTLNMVDNDFVFSAESGRPLLHVWPVNSQEQLKNRNIILPEIVNVLRVSPNNLYLAAGLGVKFYLWQLTSSKLLCIQQKHLQPITCIEFVENDYLITAGRDGLFVVYNFGSLVNLHANVLPQNEAGQVEPMYSRLDHLLPITDLHVGYFGVKSYVATISVDQTCKIYNLFHGELLLNILFPYALTAITANPAFWNIYVGCISGEITSFNLKNPPRSIESHVDKYDSTIKKFVGHNKRINCLSLNMEGNILASGSDDKQVFLWEITSRQIIRKLEHEGEITNLKFVIRHENMFAQNYKAQFIIKNLERNLDFNNEKYQVSIVQNEKIEFSDDENDVEDTSSVRSRINNLEAELNKSKVINKQLYDGMITLIKKYNNI